MLLPHPCLAPHHPLSSTPSSHVWNPTCIWYPIPCLEPHHLCLVPPSSPVWNPIRCLVSRPMTSTPPLYGTPSLSGIPSLVPHLTNVLVPLPPSGPWYFHLASNCPLPHWPLAAPIWPSYTLPSGPPGPNWPCPIWLPDIPSCSTTPCHLALLPPTIPSFPAIWIPAIPLLSLPLPAIWPSCPTTPTPSGPPDPTTHSTKYYHQRSPPLKKEIFCSFQSHLM